MLTNSLQPDIRPHAALEALKSTMKDAGWIVVSSKVPPKQPETRTENMDNKETHTNFYSATIVAELSLELRAMTKLAAQVSEQLDQLRKEHEQVKAQASFDKLSLGNKQHELVMVTAELAHAKNKIIRLLKLRETSVDVLKISSPSVRKELRRLKCKTLSDVAQINPQNTTHAVSEKLFDALTRYLENG